MKHHVDHIYSIVAGFLKKINPIYIGSIYNLRVIDSHINCTKKEKSEIDINLIIKNTNENNFYINLKKIYDEKIGECFE